MGNHETYLYVNVPFCLKRCLYCYCTLIFSDEELLSFKKNAEPFTQALLTEIDAFDGSDKKCRGVSFGGGTPSLLSVAQLERILKAVKNCCAGFDDKAQVSIETFPGTKSRDELEAMRAIGFNRASLGAQSFDDDELRFFNRAHDVKTFYKTYEDLRAAGFDNVNIDLLFGLPNSSMEKWKKSVDAALELEPEHLTAYYWYPTSGNSFYIKIMEGELKLPDRETSVEQYQYVIDAAAKRGLKRYWDFNFAREGYQYNIERDTFRLFPIRGFGPGSWSQEGTKLVWDPCRLQLYLKNPLKRWEQECTVDYYLMRVMMFPQGLVYKEFEDLFGKKWAFGLLGENVRQTLDIWIEKGLVEKDNAGFRFRKETAAEASVYLAELHTRSLYCPGEKLPVSS